MNNTIQVKYAGQDKTYNFSSNRKYNVNDIIEVRNINGSKAIAKVEKVYADEIIYEGKVIGLLNKDKKLAIKNKGLNKDYILSWKALLEYMEIKKDNSLKYKDVCNYFNEVIEGLKHISIKERGDTFEIKYCGLVMTVDTRVDIITSIRSVEMKEKKAKQHRNRRYVGFESRAYNNHLKCTKKAYEKYKKTVKGNKTVTFEMFQKKISRNIILAEPFVHKTENPKFGVIKYGCLEIVVAIKNYTVITINNHQEAPKGWVKNIKKYNELNERFGIKV